MISNLYNWHSNSARMAMTLLSITLVSLVGSPGLGADHQTASTANRLAQDAPSPEAPELDEADFEGSPEQNPSPQPVLTPLTQHRYGDLFSIGFPADWDVTIQDGEPQIVATAMDATSMDATTIDAPSTGVPILTEVTWIAAPPQQVVPQALQEIQTKGHSVLRYDAISMDGTSAIRLWLTDLPDEEAPHAFVSYVGYASGTARIVTYYRDRSPDLDNLLSTVHQSFQRLGESTPADDALDDEANQDVPSES